MCCDPKGMVEGIGRVPLMALSVPGSTSAWVCPRRRVAVWIYWPQLARVDSVAEAEGDKDAICHITCSKPVSSGCIAGVSHSLSVWRDQLSTAVKHLPRNSVSLGKSWWRLAHLSVLGCALRGECHFHLFFALCLVPGPKNANLF